MMTKTIEPIISGCANLAGNNPVIGTKVEYRLFGILLYKKLFYNPSKYGLECWDNYQIVI